MRRIFSLLLLVGAALVAGCSVQPLYVSEPVASMKLRYAEPNSRFEQVAYQTISARIPKTDDPLAPVLSLSVSGSGATPTLSNVRSPFSAPSFVTMRIVATVRDADGDVLFRDVRSATSTVERTPNRLSGDMGREASIENAIRTAADAIRLRLLGWGHDHTAD